MKKKYKKINRVGTHLELADSSTTWTYYVVQPPWIILKHLVGTDQISYR
jgi:hypothetical protein